MRTKLVAFNYLFRQRGCRLCLAWMFDDPLKLHMPLLGRARVPWHQMLSMPFTQHINFVVFGSGQNLKFFSHCKTKQSFCDKTKIASFLTFQERNTYPFIFGVDIKIWHRYLDYVYQNTKPLWQIFLSYKAFLVLSLAAQTHKLTEIAVSKHLL